MTAESVAPRLNPPSSPALTMVLEARALEARLEADLGLLGLSLRKFGILGHLRATPGLSFSALARRAGIKVQSLHPIIDALTDAGYVRAMGEVSQGRSAALALTDAGEHVVDDASRVLREIDRTTFAEGDWAALGETLNRIADAFARQRAASE